MINWKSSEEELPEKDGTYEVSNFPEAENDGLRREMTSTSWYDGYGFQYLGVYREPKYWRDPPIFKEKRYGKQNCNPIK